MADNVSFWEGLAAILGGAGTEFAERSKMGMGFGQEYKMKKFDSQLRKEEAGIMNAYTTGLKAAEQEGAMNQIKLRGHIETNIMKMQTTLGREVNNGKLSSEEADRRLRRYLGEMETETRRFDSTNQYNAIMEGIAADHPGSMIASSLTSTTDKGVIELLLNAGSEYKAQNLSGSLYTEAMKGEATPYMINAIEEKNTQLIRHLDRIIQSGVPGKKFSEVIMGQRQGTLDAKGEPTDKGEGNYHGGIKGVYEFGKKQARNMRNVNREVGDFLWSGDTEGVGSAYKELGKGAIPFYTPEEKTGNAAVQTSMGEVEQSVPEEYVNKRPKPKTSKAY